MARREHSTQELHRKLQGSGYDDNEINQAITELKSEGLLSDERFAESFTQSRIQRGHGPVRIKQELRERGISDSLAEQCLSELEIDWLEVLRGVREKKFGATLPKGYKEQSKQSRFLQYRGFSGDLIRCVFKSED